MIKKLLLNCLLPLALHASEPYLTNVEQLTSYDTFEKAGEAYFSSNNTSIIFQAVPKGQDEYQIYTLDLVSRKLKMVSTGLGACTCAYFHPTKERIIFASSHESPIQHQKEVSDTYKWDFTSYMNIYQAGLDGENMTALTEGPAYTAECAYSSDGKEIVCASNSDGHMNLYIMDENGENKRQLTFGEGFYNGGPFFSPDNQWVLFRADPDKADCLQIYRISRDGNVLEQLTNNDAVNWAPYWHPSGKMIAYTTSLHGHHRYEIYLLDIETRKNVRLTNSPSFDGLPVFSNDGSKLLWTSKRGDGTCQIFMADFKLP